MPGRPEEEGRGQHGWEGASHGEREEKRRSEVGAGETLDDPGSHSGTLEFNLGELGSHCRFCIFAKDHSGYGFQKPPCVCVHA